MFDDFQAYEPRRLGGVVDVIAEAHVGHTSQNARAVARGLRVDVRSARRTKN